ncbi:hypothetical protein ACIOC1_00410 [Streptomyces sp. NPDC088197]|uniref:hypothetical protein n=1 Tax=Streptomyces sp. NPDC088197 TaxID=3365840 RepID=UPI003809AE96
MLSFPDAEIHAEALRLGLISDGDELPRHLRSQAVASLAAEEPVDTGPDDEPPVPVPGGDLIIAGDRVLLDGQPFSLPVTTEPVEITARHGGPTTVRLTVVVGACHVLATDT